MEFTRESQRLLFVLLISCLIMFMTAIFWAVIETDSMLARNDNPRLVEREISIERGTIYDRNDNIIAETTMNNGTRIRTYPYPETHGFVGYYSLQYGVGGAESSYNNLLSGSDRSQLPENYLGETILHYPPQGSDIMLTIDLELQRLMVKEMGDYQGGAVLLSVPRGEVLGMVSLPTYDPNKLDVTWEDLRQSEEDPFFNRALQARYQPGGAIQTALITGAFINNVPVDQVLDDVDMPVSVDNLTLTCGETPPSSRLTLGEAYAYACPAPFADLYEQIGTSEVEEIFELFNLDVPPTLDNFEQPDSMLRPVEISLADALGQGELTVTPLQMASIAAAIINQGNSPLPRALMAVRSPNSQTWEQQPFRDESTAVTTAENAQRIAELMIESTYNGNARRAARNNLRIGGHASTAYTGETQISWFIGFVQIGNNQGYAIAIVLEDTSDPTIAAEMGGVILEAVYNKYSPPTDQ